MNVKIADERFLKAFEAYCSTKVLYMRLVEVRIEFLKRSGRNMVTGAPYVVLCLLLAEAHYLSSSYEGQLRTSPHHFLHEAIALASVLPDTLLQGEYDLSRYDSFVKTVQTLQQTNSEFAEMVDAFLTYDRWNPL